MAAGDKIIIANKAEVDAKLALKESIADNNAKLSLKADASYVDDKLNTKADAGMNPVAAAIVFG